MSEFEETGKKIDNYVTRYKICYLESLNSVSLRYRSLLTQTDPVTLQCHRQFRNFSKTQNTCYGHLFQTAWVTTISSMFCFMFVAMYDPGAVKCFGFYDYLVK